MLFTFTWTVWVKSINCTGFSKKKNSSLYWTVRSGAWLHCSLENQHVQTCGTAAKIGGSYQGNSLFFCYQTLIYVAAGKPHPQSHYQTASTRSHNTKHPLSDCYSLVVILKKIYKKYFRLRLVWYLYIFG